MKHDLFINIESYYASDDSNYDPDNLMPLILTELFGKINVVPPRASDYQAYSAIDRFCFSGRLATLDLETIARCIARSFMEVSRPLWQSLIDIELSIYQDQSPVSNKVFTASLEFTYPRSEED